MSGAGGRARQASVVDDVGCVCCEWAVARRLEYHGSGGVASRVNVVTGGGMDSECSALPWAVREDGHVMPAELSVR